LIEPRIIPKVEGGRPAYPLETMLRFHSDAKNWFGYSDPRMEEARKTSQSAGILRGLAARSRVPEKYGVDETT